MTITKKISIIAAACTVASSVAVGCIGLADSYIYLNDDSEKILKAAETSVVSQIDSYLERIEQSVDTLADTAMNNLDDFDAFRTSSEYVTQYSQNFEGILLSAASNTDGAITAYIRYNPDFTDPTSGIFLTRNSTDEEFQSVTPTDFSVYDKDDTAHVGWYYTPVNNGRPTWMEPYLNENIGVYMISYVIPLFSDGVNVGIVGMDIDFTTIQSISENSSVYDTYKPIIIDESANVMYSDGIDFGTNLSDINTSGGLSELISAISESESTGLISCKLDGVNRKAVFNTMDNGMKLIVLVNTAELSEQTDQLALMMLGGVVVAAAVVAVIMIFLLTRMTKPIKQLNTAAQRIADGDLNVSLDVHTNDDIGELAANFDKTVGQLKNYSGYINELSEVLNRIAGGNLDISLRLEYKGEFEKLKTALENITSSLNSTLVEIDVAADQVSTGADQVSGAAQALAAGSTEQSDSIETLVTTIGDMSKQIKANADQAQHVSASMDSIGSEANLSNERMNLMLDAIKDINANTDKISEIIKTIEDIAFQTNILALNAAIEAARAGDAGKGFAVVADEVRNLASKSAEASQNTSELISKTLEAVENGSEIANQTAESLNTVVTKIGEIVTAIDEISANSQSQSQAVTQVTAGVEQLSAVTQSNSATSEQSAAAAEELAGQANTMKMMTGKFTLKR